jgi:hypothetical protein
LDWRRPIPAVRPPEQPEPARIMDETLPEARNPDQRKTPLALFG